MKLSNGERLILIMISEIYEKLGIKGELDPEFIRDAIYGDKLWALDWKYSGLFPESEATPEAVREVCDILDMWFLIETAYEKLSPTNKATLRAAASYGDDPKFRGFDGNNESEHMSIAHFLIEKLDRYQHFKGRYLNSHSHVLHIYYRMWNVFKPLRDSLDGESLNLDQLTNILKAQTRTDAAA